MTVREVSEFVPSQNNGTVKLMWSHNGSVRCTDYAIPEATMALQYALIIQYLKLLWHWKMHWSYHTWSYCGIVRCTDHTIPETVKAKRCYNHIIPEASKSLQDALIIQYLKLLWHWSYHTLSCHGTVRCTDHTIDALIILYLKLLWHCETHWSYHTWSYYGIARCIDHTIPEAVKALRDAPIIP